LIRIRELKLSLVDNMWRPCYSHYKATTGPETAWDGHSGVAEVVALDRRRCYMVPWRRPLELSIVDWFPALIIEEIKKTCVTLLRGLLPYSGAMTDLTDFSTRRMAGWRP